jgi:hypothetical protein
VLGFEKGWLADNQGLEEAVEWEARCRVQVRDQTMTDNHQMSVMRAVLTKWGAICELSRNWNGYPTSDTTYRAAFGRGGGKRLPIPNIPAFATLTSGEVMKLPDDEGNAVTIWYAHHFNAQGQWLTGADKAMLLHVCPRTLRYRVREGEQTLITRAPKILELWDEWQASKIEQALNQYRECAA